MEIVTADNTNLQFIEIDLSSLTSTQYLGTANKKYHYDKRFECDWPGCQRRYQHHSQLFRHQLCHQRGFRSCLWPGCEYKTSHLTLLKGHVQRVHSAELPLYCEWPGCQFVADDQTMLQRHKRRCENRPQLAKMRRPYRWAKSDSNQVKKEMDSDDEAINSVYSDDDDWDEESDRVLFQSYLKTMRKLSRIRSKINQLRLPMLKKVGDLKTTKSQPTKLSANSLKTKQEGHLKDRNAIEIKQENLSAGGGRPVIIWMASTSEEPLIRTEDGLFHCSWPGCDYTVNVRSTMVVHRRRHTGERPFVCDWPGCSYQTISSKNLNRHKVTHSGVKQFQCEWPGCGHETARGYELKLHQAKMHGDQESFGTFTIRRLACDWPGCEYRCSRRDRMERHRRTHTGDKPFECTWPGCEHRCHGREALMMHLKRKHKLGAGETAEVIEEMKEDQEFKEYEEIGVQIIEIEQEVGEEVIT